MTSNEALGRWTELVRQPEDRWHLDEAALLYAAAEYPTLDVEADLRKLDDVARSCESALQASDEPVDRAAKLCFFLFEKLGFLGNREGYFDPRNSYLNEVVDRKLGIPITLSVLAIEVGRRQDILFEGIGMPGHFLIRLRDAPAFFDPYSGGWRVTEEECRERFHSIYGPEGPWSSHFLDPVQKSDILTRMLNNLKHSYLARQDYERVRTVLGFMLALNPHSQSELELQGKIEEWLRRMN